MMTEHIGILMVDSTFTRYVGDIGNSATWPFPVKYRIVEGATPAEMVALEHADVLEPFKQAADELVAAGVRGITTTCGFLGLYQKELADHLSVPVAASALLQVPMVERLIGSNKRVGVLTYSASSLSASHLEAVGVSPDVPVEGIDPDSDFYRWIMQGDNTVPFENLRHDVIDCARRLVANHEDIGAIVSECTNLTPFADDLRRELNVPVYDMVSQMNWFHQGLFPPVYTQPATR